MTSKSSGNVFVVPAEVFELLDPIEKIVIRHQAERGEVQILSKPGAVISK